MSKAGSRVERGTCELCGVHLGRRAMVRHLQACAPEHDAGSGKKEKLFLVRVSGGGAPKYWLDLEIKEQARLETLDAFFRKIWLECCGHLSAFHVGNVRYSSMPDDPFDEEDEPELSMAARFGPVLEGAGPRFTYEYDFGSTTELELEVGEVREGRIGRAGLRLLARNEPPAWTCNVCAAPATLVCPYCIDEETSFFCAEHAGPHDCETDEEAFLPVVNSPRMGVCGYTGRD